MWHASVAVVRKSGVVETREVTGKEAKAAGMLRLALIAGVGTGEVFKHTKQVAFHARRQCSPDELAGLSPEWLAIPAVDMG